MPVDVLVVSHCEQNNEDQILQPRGFDPTLSPIPESLKPKLPVLLILEAPTAVVQAKGVPNRTLHIPSKQNVTNDLFATVRAKVPALGAAGFFGAGAASRGL